MFNLCDNESFCYQRVNVVQSIISTGTYAHETRHKLQLISQYHFRTTLLMKQSIRLEM